MRMRSFGEIESHRKLHFRRMTIDKVSAWTCAASSAGMMAARFIVLRTWFHSEHARSNAAKWVFETFPLRATQASALFSPIV